MAKMTDTLVEKAAELGYDYGVSKGSWVIDGNTSEDMCRKIIKGYDDGDPEILDYAPAPLSGEWAGEPTTSSVLRALFVEDNEEHEHLIDTYEISFYQGFWDTVIQAAKAQLPED
jgi:hypothetical protein